MSSLKHKERIRTGVRFVARLSPVLMFTLLLAGNISVWQHTSDLSNDLTHHQSLNTAEQVALRIENLLRERINDLALLVTLWKNYPESERVECFLTDATRIVEQEPAYHVINYVDEQSVIRVSAPLGKRPELVGLDLKTLPGREALHQQVRSSGTPMASPPMTLTTGRPGTVIWFPILEEKDDPASFGGMIAGTFHVDQIIQRAVTASNLEEFWIRIELEETVVYSTETPEARPAQRPETLGATTAVSLLGRLWSVSVHPRAESTLARLPQDNAMRFGLNVVLSLLASGLLGVAVVAIDRVRKSRQRLQQNEIRLKTMFEAVEALFLHDFDGKILDVNRQTCESLGYTREELLSLSLGDIDVEFYSRDYKERYWQELSSDRPLIFSGVHRRKDGTTFPVEIRLGLLELEDRPLMLALTRDITERVRAEKALRQREQEFKTLVEHNPDMVARFDRECRHIYVNPAVEKELGVPPQAFLGKTYRELGMPAEQADWLYEIIHQVFERGQEQVFETVIPTHEGVRYYLTRGVPEYTEDGSVASALFIHRNVTERMQAEETLKRRNRELALLNRVIAATASTLDVEQVLQIACQELAHTFDLPQAAAALLNAERTAVTVVAEYLAPGRSRALGTAISVGGNPATEYVLAHKAPLAVTDAQTDERMAPIHDLMRERGTLSLLIVPVMERGEVVGTIGLDAIERREFSDEEIALAQNVAAAAGQALETARLYQELERHAAELAHALEQRQELDRLRSEFIRNVSHELRTPLAIARGHTELLETGVLGELQPEQHGSVTVIARRMRMLSGMMDDFAAIVDIETGLQRHPVDLTELVRGLLADSQVRATAERADLTLTVEVAPDMPLVSGDAIQLQRVVDNLLDNAFKFTPAGGQVTVRLGQEGENLALEVSDTGIGIPDDQFERIFERFYQIDGSTTRRYGGTGLGLALVKAIVEAHGGQVMVQSVLGEGSTFTVILPIYSVNLSLLMQTGANL